MYLHSRQAWCEWTPLLPRARAGMGILKEAHLFFVQEPLPEVENQGKAPPPTSRGTPPSISILIDIDQYPFCYKVRLTSSLTILFSPDASSLPLSRDPRSKSDYKVRPFPSAPPPFEIAFTPVKL